VRHLEDEHGGDEKFVCVPDDKTFPYYTKVGDRDDLPEIVMQQIEHFFTHYKDLESEKWVRIGKWGDAEEAKRILLEAIERAKGAEAA
jgi:inorganic pyrophosphatase